MFLEKHFPRVVALLRLDMKNERAGGGLNRKKHVSAPLGRWLSGSRAAAHPFSASSARRQPPLGVTFQSGLNRVLVEPHYFLLSDQSCSEGLVGIGGRSLNIILANLFCELQNR